MSKKKILTVAIALTLVALIGLGSLAFFNDSKSVTNKFLTFKTSGPDEPPITPGDIFSIKLEETGLDGSKTTEGVTYEKVLPGSVLAKDPTVTNTGIYDAWVRVDVTIDKAATWKTIIPAGYDLSAIFGGFDSSKWTLAGKSESGDTITYSYYLNERLVAADEEASVAAGSATLFTSVTIPTSITVDQMVELNGFTIVISGAAVQADNNGSSPAEADGWPA